MKKNYFKSFAVALLAMCGVSASADNNWSVDPISIGAGQVITVFFECNNDMTDCGSFEFEMTLPAGVDVVGIDKTAKSSDAPVTVNESRIKASDFTLTYRSSKGNYKAMYTASAGSKLQGNSGWVFAVEMTSEGGASGQITFAKMKFVTNEGDKETVAEADLPKVDVTVSDKFIAPCNADGYCTICPTIGLDLSGVDAYIVTGASGESVTLKKITELAAGDAAVVKGSGNVEIPLKSGATTSESGNKLVGVQKYTDTSGAAEYFLVGAEFVKAAATSHLAAGRAYLAGLGSGAKVLNLSFDDDATAIQSVEAEQNNGVLYNLNGVRVDNAVKGVYIQNGRKVVIK